jgi:hypothetical protein
METIEIIWLLLGINIILLKNYLTDDPIILIKEKLENFCFNCIDNEQ